MESSIAPVTFFLSLYADEAYAGTSEMEMLLVNQQIQNFKPVKTGDLEPDNRECDICFEPFGIQEEPIKLLSCGHIFGHGCLYHWAAQFLPSGRWFKWEAPRSPFASLSEDAFRRKEQDIFSEAIHYTDVEDVTKAYQDDGLLKRDWREYLNWNSDTFEDLMPPTEKQLLTESIIIPGISCPKCRGKFPILKSGVIRMAIEARLRFWDRLYEKLELSRSAKEEQSRTKLLRYVQMVQLPKMDIRPEHMRSFTLQAQASAMRFALRRGNRDLDPLQLFFRDAIFNLGCYGLNDGDYRARSYETRRVPVWCYQIDRIERGLSPVIGPTTWVVDLSLEPAQVESMEYSKAFYQGLIQLASGPWRRTLFKEAGGDREGLRWDPLGMPSSSSNVSD